MKKHPLAIAGDEWMTRSPESFTSATLGHVSPDSYLENRLRAAFNAGAKAGELLAYNTVALGVTETRKLTERESP